MSFSERLGKIVDAPFDVGAQAADFFVDAAVHTGKNINPIDALIESFKDNIMGKQSETGTGEKNVASALMGPEGVIGAPAGALPGFIRDPFSTLIWTPFLDSMQFTYKNFIDRPIGTLATVERMVSSEITGEDTNILDRTGNLVEQLVPGVGESKLYNWSTYQQAWDVTQSRSAGQALALSAFHIDIMDPKALEEFKGTDWYFATSGIIDFALNIGLDPLYLTARAARWSYAMRRAKETYRAGGGYDPNMVQTSLAPFEFRPIKPNRKGQPRLRDEAFWENWSYRPTFLDEPVALTVDETINSVGFDKFREEIWNIAEEVRGGRRGEGQIDLVHPVTYLDMPGRADTFANKQIVADDFGTPLNVERHGVVGERGGVVYHGSASRDLHSWIDPQTGELVINANYLTPDSALPSVSFSFDPTVSLGYANNPRMWRGEHATGGQGHGLIFEIDIRGLDPYIDARTAKMPHASLGEIRVDFDPKAGEGILGGVSEIRIPKEQFRVIDAGANPNVRPLRPEGIWQGDIWVDIDEAIAKGWYVEPEWVPPSGGSASSRRLELEAKTAEELWAEVRNTEKATGKNHLSDEVRFPKKPKGSILKGSSLQDPAYQAVLIDWILDVERKAGVPEVKPLTGFEDEFGKAFIDAGKQGRLGKGWDRPAEDMYTWGRTIAKVIGDGPVTNQSWLPFDNLMKVALAGTGGFPALERQAGLLASIMFQVDNLGGGRVLVDQMQSMTDEILELERRSRNTNDLQEVDTIARRIEDLERERRALADVNPQLVDDVMEVVADALNQGETGVANLLGQIDTPSFRVPEMGTPEFNQMWKDLGDLQNVPWNAILSLKNNIVETLIKDVPNGFGTPTVLDKYATEVGNNVVKAAADEILDAHRVPTLPDAQLPYLGASNRLGYKAKTFFEKSGTYRNVRGTNAVQMVVDKVAQNIIDLQQPSAAYIQVERMLRDVQRIPAPRATEIPYRQTNILEAAGLNADDVLIEFLNKSNDRNALAAHFDDVVKRINDTIVEQLGAIVDDGVVVSLGPDDLRKILNGQIIEAKELLNKAADETQRSFGNVDFTEVIWEQSRGETVKRRIPISPSQMRKASLVPRYDLIDRYVKMVNGDMKTVPTPDGPKQISVAPERAKVQAARRMISTAWKRGVLLTPRWQMVVNVDSMLRNFAHLGVADSMSGIGVRVDRLRARWLERAGIDVQGIVVGKIDEVLGIPGETLSFVEKVQEYNRLYDEGTVKTNYEGLMDETIREEYAAGRQKRRTVFMSGLGLFFAGPAGAAASGALYGRHARKSQVLLARRKVATGYGEALLLDAKHMVDEVEQAERAVLEGLDDRSVLELDLLTPEEVNKLGADMTLAEVFAQAKKDRREAAKLLMARSEGVTTYQRMVVENFRKELPEAAGKLDEAAELLGDLGYNQSMLGSNAIPNPWGDNPQLRAVIERINSANPTKRQIWSDTNAEMRRNEAFNETHQYDISNSYEGDAFVRAYDAFVQNHVSSPGMAGVSLERDFWRQQWLGKTDEEIYEWLSTEGRPVLDSLPDEWRSPEARMELIRRTRYEANSLVPDLPEFAGVRERLAKGELISWDRDIQPIVNVLQERAKLYLDETAITGDINTIPTGSVFDDAMHYAVTSRLDGSVNLHGSKPVSNAAKDVLQQVDAIEILRGRAKELDAQAHSPADYDRLAPLIDFGKTVNDSSYLDGLKTGTQIKQAKEIIRHVTDTWFENLTEVENTISRGTMFEAAYERQMAIEMQRYRNSDGSYRIPDAGNAIEEMSQRARRYALNETKKILYELADRTRFEEIVTELFPFLGAWQEVATRWMGLAGENPVFIARALRAWSLVTGEDDEGNPRIVIPMPGFLDSNIGDMKLFGKLSQLANQDINLNLESASMIGALPGFGPLVSFAVSDLIVANPELDESLGWMVPYGFVEGEEIYTRFINSHTPSWVRNGAKAIGMTDAGKAKTAALVTQDMITQYVEEGRELPQTAVELAAFEDEVERRTKAIYGIYMLRSIAVPVSFRQQSPYWGIIKEMWDISKEHGSDVATAWLLENHPDLWAFTARTTMAQGVRAGTIEGHEKYQQHQDFMENNPQLAPLVRGEFGALDVQFNYNRAVAEQERREGRRDYMNPAGILTDSSVSMGWREWRVFRNSMDDELRKRAMGGGSSSLLANSNFDLWKDRRKFIEDLGQENSFWLEEFNTFGQPQVQKEVLAGLREFISLEEFAYRPEIGQIAMFVGKHDQLALKMVKRAEGTNNRSYLRMSYSGNQDIRQEWDVFLLEVLSYPSFGPIYDRYFSNMLSISVGNLPTGLITEYEVAA